MMKEAINTKATQTRTVTLELSEDELFALRVCIGYRGLVAMTLLSQNFGDEGKTLINALDDRFHDLLEKM